MSPKDTAYIVERLAVRFMSMVADYERQLAEHRASFGARTEADRQIIEGLRSDLAKERAEHQADADHLNEEIARFRGIADDLCNRLNALGIKAAKQANIALGMVEGEGLLGAAQRVVKERDALRAEVADLRGTFDMVHASLGIKRGDHIGNAIAVLKSQNPKRSHPVKDGEYVRRTKSACAHFGYVAKVLAFIEPCSYEVQCIEGRGIWYFHNCEPCDPPVDHNTPAGKEAAEAASKVPQ